MKILQNLEKIYQYGAGQLQHAQPFVPKHIFPSV